MSTKEENDKKAAAGRLWMLHLEEVKELVKEKEVGNYDKLIVFRSRGGWWKLGGNSALIYFYKIAPELNKKPRLLRDSDFFSKFHDGVISIKDLDKLEKDLAKLGIKYRKGANESELIRIFELKKECTEEELKELKAIRRRKSRELNEIVEPKLLIPRVGVILKDTTATMYRIKLPERNPREIRLVDNLVAEAMEATADFVMACKNNQGTIEDLRSTSRRISRLMLKVEMMKELDVWAVEKCILICDRLDEAQRLVNKRIKVLEKREKEEENVGEKDDEDFSERERWKREGLEDVRESERIREMVTSTVGKSKPSGKKR